MKIRLSLSLSIERHHPTTADADPPHMLESSGSLVETVPQPRYVGFQPEE